MKRMAEIEQGWRLFAVAAVLVGSLSVFTHYAQAQGSHGQDAVYNSSNGIVGSSSFIDASMFLPPKGTQASDICDAIFYIFTHNYTAGWVIDARGISGTTSLTCTHGTPWTEGSTTVTAASTILLPAGTIVIPSKWVLPSNTHLIGEGSTISGGFTPGTTLQISSSFTAGDPMIRFGSSSGCCSAISVEKLTLDGNAAFVNGIENSNAGELSYVDHVSLYRILGTGLWVHSTANNSGPYSNITYDLGGYSGNSSTICASINGLSGTRGIHGLSCIAENNDPPAAVLLDSNNNSIEDVKIVGFYDGILVGANAPAQSNVLINVIGDTNNVCYPGCTTPVRAIHISSNQTSGSSNVSDLSIMGVGNNAPSGTYTIWDDLTAAHIADASVGIYAIGEAISGGHSRFTTSPNAAHWTVGTAAPMGSCTRGSLYSCTGPSGVNCSNGTSNAALWVCGPSLGWLAIR